MGLAPDEPEGESLYHVIPYEYASEIAYVISFWALLEHEIDTAIWSFAGLEYTPRLGACLTAQFTTVVARFNALTALARVRGVPEFEISKLNKYRERVLGLADRRNRVAHDPWLSTWNLDTNRTEKIYRLQKTARSKLEFEYKRSTLEELKTLRDEIQKAIDEFSNLNLNPTIDEHDT